MTLGGSSSRSLPCIVQSSGPYCLAGVALQSPMAGAPARRGADTTGCVGPSGNRCGCTARLRLPVRAQLASRSCVSRTHSHRESIFILHLFRLLSYGGAADHLHLILLLGLQVSLVRWRHLARQSMGSAYPSGAILFFLEFYLVIEVLSTSKVSSFSTTDKKILLRSALAASRRLHHHV